MKDLFFRFCRWALPFFGVSAVVSCDNVFNTPDMYGTQVAEYGVPIMEYVVKGKVTDAETGAPVKGIEVVPEEANVLVYTSENGEFACEGATFPDGKVTITFKDIDGEENGVYATKEIEVPVENVIPVNAKIPGCAVRPQDVLAGVVSLLPILLDAD